MGEGPSGPGDGLLWHVPGYTGLRPLGRGAFGEVVLARHDGSGTLVAIKYLRADLLTDQGFREIFRREAAVLSTLDDQNVVRLYEYIESDYGAAIVMELVHGVSLREILSHYGQTTPEAALVVLQGSLLGLAAAHWRGIVHRDFKPANVLVNGEGLSKLTDFGIAARAGDQPIPAGTLAYAAPEQMRGARASPASDVYSATATFYECLTGRPPFTADTAERLMYQHQFDPVPLEPVPGPLRQLVEAGMAKQPERRPTNGTHLVAALRAAAAGACGPDWEDRGRSHLGEAALLLAALWPLGGPPAVQGLTVENLELSREGYLPKHGGPPESAETRHFWHVLHLEHLAHLLHLRRIRLGGATVAAIVAVVVVAAGAALAAVLIHGPKTTPAPAAADSPSLQPSSSSPSPSPSASKKPKPTSSPSSVPPVFAPTSVPTSSTPTPTTSSSKSSSPTPSPSPSPTPSASPSPSSTSPSPSPSSTSPSPSPSSTSPSPSPSTSTPIFF